MFRVERNGCYRTVLHIDTKKQILTRPNQCLILHGRNDRSTLRSDSSLLLGLEEEATDVRTEFHLFVNTEKSFVTMSKDEELRLQKGNESFYYYLPSEILPEL
jgi:hypothetical protein